MIVNSIEYITGPPLTYNLNFVNFNAIPASNTTEEICGGVFSSYTYTNFVDFLNNTFTTLGLTNYTAQLSLVGRELGGSTKTGFYIIHPATDSFRFNISDELFPNEVTYTQNTIIGYGGYYKMTCCDINLVGNVVIE